MRSFYKLLTCFYFCLTESLAFKPWLPPWYTFSNYHSTLQLFCIYFSQLLKLKCKSCESRDHALFMLVSLAQGLVYSRQMFLAEVSALGDFRNRSQVRILLPHNRAFLPLPLISIFISHMFSFEGKRIFSWRFNIVSSFTFDFILASATIIYKQYQIKQEFEQSPARHGGANLQSYKKSRQEDYLRKVLSSKPTWVSQLLSCCCILNMMTKTAQIRESLFWLINYRGITMKGKHEATSRHGGRCRKFTY